ncbi:MAG TPA: hypothetical protein VH591_13415 [Ktedonobacterales bacterium]
MLGNLVYVVLGGAVLLLAAILIVAAQHIPPSTASDTSANTSYNSGWIPLSSNSSSAVIAAARQSTLFNVNRKGSGDFLKDLSHLETPVLVRALQVPGSVVMPDYYIIPIDDAAGKMVGAAQLELNASHTSVQVTSIATYTSAHPHGQVSHLAKSAALTDLSNQRRVELRSGAQPQLVYIPIDAAALESGQVVWNGGGLSPTDPVWLIPGADGQNHIVGADGHAYDMSSVPVMKQQP